MKIRDLEELIKNKKEEAFNKLAINDIDSAKKLRDEIKNLKEQLELQKELEEEDKSKIINNNTNSNFKPLQVNESGEDLMVEYFKKSYKGSITNSMEENFTVDGFYVVPKDVSVSINELLRERKSLKELVSIDKVGMLESSRTYEVNMDDVPFDKIEPGERVFKNSPTPRYKTIHYKISRYGGSIKTGPGILEELPINLINYLKDWFVSKMEATYNNLILKKANETLTKVETIKSYDDIKNILNTKIDTELKDGTIILTNQTGYNWLDTLKDKNDDYILKPLIKDPAVKSIEGTIKVVAIEDDLLPVGKNNKVPFYIGNFKKFIKIFDRDFLTIKVSKDEKYFPNKEELYIQATFSVDLQIIEDNAVVKCVLQMPTAKKEN